MQQPLPGATTGAPGQTTQAEVDDAQKRRDQKINRKKPDEEQSERGPRAKRPGANADDRDPPPLKSHGHPMPAQSRRGEVNDGRRKG